MTKIELEKQIAEMQEQFDKMQKQLNELKEFKLKEPKKMWKPEKNQIYYFVNAEGFICECVWWDDEEDNYRYSTNNVFKPKKEAEEYRKKIEFQSKFKNFLKERNNELDWNDYNQSKWYMYYNHYRKEIMFLDETFNKNQGTIYASSEQILEDAIAEIGEDNVKKYVLEVEDE